MVSALDSGASGWVRALAGDIVLYSLGRHLNVISRLTQVSCFFSGPNWLLVFSVCRFLFYRRWSLA